MYPTLRDLIFDWFGVNIPFLQVIQSYGMMVAIAFIVSAYALMLELKRKEKEQRLFPVKKKIRVGEPASTTELMSSAFWGFVLGYKIIGVFFVYDFFVNNPQAYILSLEGSLVGGLLTGAVSAYLKYAEKNKHKLDKPKDEEIEVHPYELTGNIVVYAAIFGILGAKIFNSLENIDDFMADPWGSLFSFSGLTYYGGLIVAAAAILIYAKKNGINIIHLLDAAAPALLLAYGVGRIGCQISGDGCWGVVNTLPKPHWLGFLPDWAWAYNYPHNVINEGVPATNCLGKHCMVLDSPVFPTPLYESTLNVLAFLVLWFIRKKITIPGLLFSIYLIVNGVERFFIEKIRVNTQYHILGHGITQAEIISFCLIVFGAIGIWYFIKRYKKDAVK